MNISNGVCIVLIALIIVFLYKIYQDLKPRPPIDQISIQQFKQHPYWLYAKSQKSTTNNVKEWLDSHSAVDQTNLVQYVKQELDYWNRKKYIEPDRKRIAYLQWLNALTDSLLDIAKEDYEKPSIKFDTKTNHGKMLNIEYWTNPAGLKTPEYIKSIKIKFADKIIINYSINSKQNSIDFRDQENRFNAKLETEDIKIHDKVIVHVDYYQHKTSNLFDEITHTFGIHDVPEDYFAITIKEEK